MQALARCVANLKLKLPGVRKLHPRFIGPLEVKEIIGPVNVLLKLPEVWSRVHTVFHVSLIRPYLPGTKLAKIAQLGGV
jgi:hypothetical protein